MFKGVILIEFSARFSIDERCHEYLAEIKWGDSYQCAKCGHKKYFKGKRLREGVVPNVIMTNPRQLTRYSIK